MTLRSNFADAGHWDELAKSHSYRLPKWSEPCSVERMRLWMDRLNISNRLYKEQTGTTLDQFIELNPAWPLRAFVGLLMELSR